MGYGKSMELIISTTWRPKGKTLWAQVKCSVRARQMCILFFKSLFIYFRQRRREREKESEEHPRVVASHAPPTWDLTWPAAQACALTENQTRSPLVCRSVFNPLSHTRQGTSVSLYLGQQSWRSSGDYSRPMESLSFFWTRFLNCEVSHLWKRCLPAGSWWQPSGENCRTLTPLAEAGEPWRSAPAHATMCPGTLARVHTGALPLYWSCMCIDPHGYVLRCVCVCTLHLCVSQALIPSINVVLSLKSCFKISI